MNILSQLRKSLTEPPTPISFRQCLPSQTRPGFHIHDLPEISQSHESNPVTTEWKLSWYGRLVTLVTGRILTTVWSNKNPPMSVEYHVINRKNGTEPIATYEQTPQQCL